jgi:carbon-monoxide dehydrogenase medium subunit
MDIAIAGAAVSVGAGQARVALCAVAPTPLRVIDAEAVLAEQGLKAGAIERAAALAVAAARPITDVRATAEYRRQMVGVLVRRGLEALRDG